MREGSGGAASRRFSFKSTTKTEPPANKIFLPGAGTPGDPTLGGASLTVYNSSGTGEKFPLPLPASGWTVNAKGYRFRAASSTDAIQRVTVKHDSVRIRGGRDQFLYSLNEVSQGSIAVAPAGGNHGANALAKAGSNHDVAKSSFPAGARARRLSRSRERSVMRLLASSRRVAVGWRDACPDPHQLRERPRRPALADGSWLSRSTRTTTGSPSTAWASAP
jgi:hypothetical protein